MQAMRSLRKPSVSGPRTKIRSLLNGFDVNLPKRLGDHADV